MRAGVMHFQALGQGCEIPLLPVVNAMSRPARAGRCHTGVAISGKSISIATVFAYRNTLTLNEAKLAVLEFDLACQAAFHEAIDDIQTWITRKRIKSLLLRGLPSGGGEMAARGSAYRLETMLQLTRGVSIRTMAPQVLTRWFGAYDVSLPPTGHLLTGAQRRPMERALVAAAYQAMLKGDLTVDGGACGRA